MVGSVLLTLLAAAVEARTAALTAALISHLEALAETQVPRFIEQYANQAPLCTLEKGRWQMIPSCQLLTLYNVHFISGIKTFKTKGQAVGT
jgi:hypothetical protein